MTSKGKRCPVCGAEGSACGAPGPDTGFTIERATGGPVQLYEVTINGHVTVMKLNSMDAHRLGGVPVKASEAENKSRTVANKGVDADGGEPGEPRTHRRRPRRSRQGTLGD